jgi:hypothetical protein
MVIGQTRQTEARVKTNAPRKIEKRKSRRSRRIPVDLLLPIGVHLSFHLWQKIFAFLSPKQNFPIKKHFPKSCPTNDLRTSHTIIPKYSKNIS